MASEGNVIAPAGVLLQQLRIEFADDRVGWQLVAIAVCVAIAWLLARRFATWRWQRARAASVQEAIDVPIEAPVILADMASILDADPARLGELTVAAAEQRAADAALVARRRRDASPPSSPFAGVFFPASVYLLLALATGILGHYQSSELLRLTLPVVGAWAAMRLLGFLLRRLSGAPSMRALERGIAVAVAVAVLLHLLGHLEPIAEALGAMRLPFGGDLSLLQLMRSVFWLGLTILVAYWLGSLLESRLLRFDAIDISLRTVLVRMVRAFLLVIAVLFGLSIVGIDITALSVFGGALGVGIGLGLQRIASNYVSGLIILLERSVRPGDSIRIGTLEGTITAIRTRYSVLRAGDGVEIIVPNEVLTGQTVHNVTTGGRLRRATRLQIAYGSDPAQVIELLLGAIRSNPHVLAEPGPSARLVGFGAAGLEFEFAFHIGEPSPGGGNIASDVNRAVYAALLGAGLEISAA